MTTAPGQGRPISRRTAMAGSALAAGAALAACDTSTPNTSAPTPGARRRPGSLPEFGSAPPTTPGTTTTKPGATPETRGPATTPGTDPPVTLNDSTLPALVVAKTSAIPVGGGVIFPKHGVVVTQPTAGKFECFSTSCTHLGCTLNKIAAGLIRCPCHGARFSVVDGSVKAGPATRPLTKQPFTIENGTIVLS